MRATEIDPPEGEEPLEWTIFTDLPCESFEAADEVLKIYARRWEIEVFFRGLKSGCQIEEVQLEAREALEKAICCYLVVAWRILYLTKLGRTCPELPCDSVFETEEWQAVWAVGHGRGPLPQPGRRVPTPGELLPLVAGFGGHRNRRGGDGPPGAQAMWEAKNGKLRPFSPRRLVYKAQG